MTSYIENKPLVPDTLVLARGNVLNRLDENVLNRSDENVLNRSDENVLNRSDENVLNRSDENVLKKRYVESLDELDRIALNVARSTLGSLFSLEKSNHYMEWKSAQRDRSANKNA
jgi:hypothetical protein